MNNSIYETMSEGLKEIYKGQSADEAIREYMAGRPNYFGMLCFQAKTGIKSNPVVRYER